jgi:hypothetical protein
VARPRREERQREAVPVEPLAVDARLHQKRERVRLAERRSEVRRREAPRVLGVDVAVELVERDTTKDTRTGRSPPRNGST